MTINQPVRDSIIERARQHLAALILVALAG
jgi:hypothetical protein